MSRDEIKFPYALPSNMNNIYQDKQYIDRDLQNSRDIKPVQSQIQFDKINEYQFDNYNLDKDINKYIEYCPVDTRQQQYNLNRHNDILYNYNTQGYINNFVDNTPSTTRKDTNRQTKGVDTNLMPTRLMHIPPNNV